nr:MAG TPA: helix-turn-helix domain protein [Caudoviricetes sp.]
MSTINERVQAVINATQLSKAKFADPIHVTPQFLSAVCNGKSSLSERTIKDICREYGVDEIWLRDGIGEMFRPRTREDEITTFCADLLGPDATDFQRDFVAILATLSPEGWDLLEKKINELAELSRRRKENEK